MVEILQQFADWFDLHIAQNERIPKFIRIALDWLLAVLIMPLGIAGMIVAGVCLLFSVLIGAISREYARELWDDLLSTAAEL